MAAIQARLSDSYSNLSTTTAENKKAYEHSLNNTLTTLTEGINRVMFFQELYDENGDTPWMSFLNPEYNPAVLSSRLLNSIFRLDVPMTDPNFGKKRSLTTKKNAELATLILENISGVQMTSEGRFFEKGIGSASSDRATKFISDFHMLLDSGHIELMRAGSKTASFGMRTKNVIGNAQTKNENHLYVGTWTFMDTGSREYSNADNRDLQDIVLGYLQSEILRAGIIRNNKAVYDNIPGYKNGDTLSIFDDIIQPSEKELLLTDKFYKDLLGSESKLSQVLNKPEYQPLAFKIRKQIGTYFDKLSKKTEEEMVKDEYISPQLMEKIIFAYDPENKGGFLTNTAPVRNAMIRSYTVNRWIHNVESTIIVYGDVVQFSHEKDEFNKRNSSWQSTGYLFRTDRAAQDFINNIWKRPYLQKYAEKNPGKISTDVLNRKYDGTMNTAVLKEPVYKSYLYKYYADKNRDYYSDLLKKKGYSKAQIKKMVDQILYGEGGTFDNPAGGIMEPYFKMKVADGQGYVTFDAYRTLRKLEGKWLDIHEKNYQRIINGETLTPEEIRIFYPPYKCIYAGFLKSKTLPVSSVHKFSLLPLIPGLVKDANIEKLHNKMMEQGIDYVLFESGSKVNHIGKGDEIFTDMEKKIFNEDVKFTPNVIYLNYLKNQVDIGMEFKGKNIFSTQLRKIAIQGLYNEGQAVSPEAKKKGDAYISLVDQLTELKRKEFLEDAGYVEDKDGNLKGDVSDLINYVKKQLSNLGLADHEIEYIDVDPETGEPMYDWSGHMSRERLERLVVALVNNRLIKQNMYGESLVQASNALFEKPEKLRNATQEELEKHGYDTLPTYTEGKDGKTTAAKTKIAMQGEFMNLLKLQHPDGKKIGVYDKIIDKNGEFEYKLNMAESLKRLNGLIKNEEWLDKDDNRKKITMVGVRIPVQGLGQIEFMEVYEFLDPSASNIVILPYEIVAKSGGDFDIDKLNIFMPRITTSGEFLKTKYKTTDQIQKAIDKLKEQKTAFLKSIDADKKLSEIEKELKGNLKEQRKALETLGSQIALAKEEKRQIVMDMRIALSKAATIKNLDKDIIDVIQNGNDQEFMALVSELRKSKRLYKISKQAASISQESYDNYVKLKELRDKYKLSEVEFDKLQSGVDKASEFSDKIADLYEQKRNFIGTYENRMIDSIVDIISMKDNFIHLIRPNSTDLVKGVSDELKQFVQENDHRISMLDGSRRKKGISPTRVFEPIFNLDKHQSNNVGKKSLGIAAQVNVANVISTSIGGYIPGQFTFIETEYETDPVTKKRVAKDVEIKIPIKLNLNHNIVYKNGLYYANIFGTDGLMYMMLMV